MFWSCLLNLGSVVFVHISWIDLESEYCIDERRRANVSIAVVLHVFTFGIGRISRCCCQQCPHVFSALKSWGCLQYWMKSGWSRITGVRNNSLSVLVLICFSSVLGNVLLDSTQSHSHAPFPLRQWNLRLEEVLFCQRISKWLYDIDANCINCHWNNLFALCSHNLQHFIEVDVRNR